MKTNFYLRVTCVSIVPGLEEESPRSPGEANPELSTAHPWQAGVGAAELKCGSKIQDTEPEGGKLRGGEAVGEGAEKGLEELQHLPRWVCSMGGFFL